LTAAAARSAEPLPRAADLPTGFGYLIVGFPTAAQVYISGKELGPANQQLKVACGRWFVRLSTPSGGKNPEWVSIGQTVSVNCQGLTTVEFKPGQSSSPPRKRR
jgi:hypothetical protein